MSYVNALRLVKSLSSDSPKRSLTLATSFQSENINIYLQALYAKAETRLNVTNLPFNTLQQYILEKRFGESVILLLPWDILPGFDWRTGIVEPSLTLEEATLKIDQFMQLMPESQPLVYIDAPHPPFLSTVEEDAYLRRIMMQSVAAQGGVVVGEEVFDLANYLESGIAIRGKSASDVAEALWCQLEKKRTSERKKVLITDLDNTLWQGVVAEEPVEYSPKGKGFPFFIYQTFLKRLKQSGILLAAVSKNDLDVALKPFDDGGMVLCQEDFVAIVASYEAKSGQIKMLADNLNLGLDSFVFVDDNPVELEEVSRAIDGIEVLRFPPDHSAMSYFFRTLHQLFQTTELTEEDKRRTEMYRASMKSISSVESSGADITSFYQSLDMKLTIYNRSLSDNQRAIQLINKTNQFNLNGLRVSEGEFKTLVSEGCQVYSAGLSDCNGDHGEIMVCIVSPHNEILYWVQSCRVLKRTVEFAFLRWLIGYVNTDKEFDFKVKKTKRNSPLMSSLKEIGIGEDISQLKSAELLAKLEGRGAAIEVSFKGMK